MKPTLTLLTTLLLAPLAYPGFACSACARAGRTTHLPPERAKKLLDQATGK